MKKINVNGREINLYTCTAIALCDHESEDARQSAVYEVSFTDFGEKIENIIFGCSVSDIESADDYSDYAEQNPDCFEALADEHHMELGV